MWKEKGRRDQRRDHERGNKSHVRGGCVMENSNISGNGDRGKKKV